MHVKERKGCTSKRTVEEGSIFPDAGDRLVRTPGPAAAWSMHSSDSYWFSASESPTNITVLPLHIFSSAAPSNLHCHPVSDVAITQSVQTSPDGRKFLPGLSARRVEVPPVLEVHGVGAAEARARELVADEGAPRRVVERVRLVHHPRARRREGGAGPRRRRRRRPAAMVLLPRDGHGGGGGRARRKHHHRQRGCPQNARPLRHRPPAAAAPAGTPTHSTEREKKPM